MVALLDARVPTPATVIDVAIGLQAFNTRTVEATTVAMPA
jgi:hypothetical protein